MPILSSIRTKGGRNPGLTAIQLSFENVGVSSRVMDAMPSSDQNIAEHIAHVTHVDKITARVSSYLNSLYFKESLSEGHLVEFSSESSESNDREIVIEDGWTIVGVHGRMSLKKRITALGFILIK